MRVIKTAGYIIAENMGISGDYQTGNGFPGYNTGPGESVLFTSKDDEIPFINKKKRKPKKYRLDEDVRNIKSPWSYI
jgi:hypothetical protein